MGASRTPSRRRRGGFAAVLAGLVLAALPGATPAAESPGSDPAGDVKARGLTKKERNALDLVSVRAFGEEGLGLFVLATFRGNVTKAIGRGHLKDALVALVAEPLPGAGQAAGLITSGAGPVGETVRRTTSERVGIVRNGREVFFFVAGPGFSRAQAAVVKAFARTPAPAPTARSAQPPDVEPGLWGSILARKGADGAAVELDQQPLSCEELTDLSAILEDARQAATFVRAEGIAERLGEILVLDVGAMAARRCGGDPFAVTGEITMSLFMPGEVRVVGTITSDPPGATFGALEIALPPTQASPRGAGATIARTITSYICPAQLPTGRVSGTVGLQDTLTCSGGTLAAGQEFVLQIRMSPPPVSGMGAQLFAVHDGTPLGPIEVTGP